MHVHLHNYSQKHIQQGWRKQFDFGMAVAPENEAYIICSAGSAFVSRADLRICLLPERTSCVLIN